MPTLAQISLWKNPETGETHCEIPQFGQRRKIELPKDKRLWGEILEHELEISAQWINDQKLREKEIKTQYEHEKAEKEFQLAWAKHKKVWGKSPEMEAFAPRRRYISVDDMLED